jgi:hypothetical protein
MIVEDITIGGQDLCEGWQGPVLHACRVPCWIRQIQPEGQRLAILPVEDDLYLNLDDVRDPRYLYVRTFQAGMDWLDLNQWADPLVHCNKGLSRAPTILLLWMARKRRISSFNFQSARHEFEFDRDYRPGRGIEEFLTTRWEELMHQ